MKRTILLTTLVGGVGLLAMLIPDRGLGAAAAAPTIAESCTKCVASIFYDAGECGSGGSGCGIITFGVKQTTDGTCDMGCNQTGQCSFLQFYSTRVPLGGSACGFCTRSRLDHGSWGGWSCGATQNPGQIQENLSLSDSLDCGHTEDFDISCGPDASPARVIFECDPCS